MEYSLIEITDPRFVNLSNIVLSNAEELIPLTQGDIGSDSVDSATSLPSNFNTVELTNPDSTNLTVRSAVSSLLDQEEQTQGLFCTLASYYPNGGFIGWHTNSNFTMYNAICTFSDTGESYFEYSDNSEIIRLNDEIGWNVKKTFWSKETPVKHRAVSNCNRITLAFSSKEESIIDTFISKITS